VNIQVPPAVEVEGQPAVYVAPPIPIARHPFNPEWPVHDLHSMDRVCDACKALHWLDERLTKSSKRHPKFGMCCYSGKIILPKLHKLPQELYKYLVGSDPISKGFRLNIRTYNNALAMTSVGRKLDYSVNMGRGPYVFKLHGELSHRIGSLLPAEGEEPLYAQLYVIDTAHAHDMRMINPWNAMLDAGVMQNLQDMLHNCHPAVQFFKQAFTKTSNMSRDQNCRVVLRFDQGCDWNRYNTPSATTNEIAVIIPGGDDQIRGSQDIVLYHRDGSLQRINDCHPLYPSLHYVLLFPTGQLGWYPKIPKQQVEEGADNNEEKYVTLVNCTKTFQLFNFSTFSS
jgi:hypothetical protein